MYFIVKLRTKIFNCLAAFLALTSTNAMAAEHYEIELFNNESIVETRLHLVANAVVDQACSFVAEQCLYWLNHLEDIDVELKELTISEQTNGHLIASARVGINRLNIEVKDNNHSYTKYLGALVRSRHLSWSMKQAMIEELRTGVSP